MIFATYSYQGNTTIGIVSLETNSITPIGDFFSAQNLPASKDMNALIDCYDNSIHVEMSRWVKEKTFSPIPLTDVKLEAPIPYPKRNVICLGKNYADHIKEIRDCVGPSDVPEHPIYFTKSAYPCIGTGDTILKHSNATQKIDYEVELGVVIGKRGVNISKDDAESYIFGYTVGNDISARDLQRQHVNWFKGKSLQSHCSIGPWIVHKSLIPFPVKLDIKSWVNHELRQNSNTDNLIFDIPYILSDLSKGMELLPGDIIMTGTPAGVGLGFNPPKYLQSGDKIECTIEQIGTLVNYVEK